MPTTVRYSNDQSPTRPSNESGRENRSAEVRESSASPEPANRAIDKPSTHGMQTRKRFKMGANGSSSFALIVRENGVNDASDVPLKGKD